MKYYDNIPTYDNVCRALRYMAPLNDNELVWVEGVQQWMERTRFITSAQQQELGRLSKKHLQNGKYQLHDWWDGTLDKMLEEWETSIFGENSDEIVV